MKLKDIHEIIASRNLEARNADGGKEVIVVIGKPTIYPDSGDYFTPYQIIGVDSEKIGYSYGIDAVQSLQLAMKMIGYDLVAINESLGKTLTWVGDETGKLGFDTID